MASSSAQQKDPWKAYQNMVRSQEVLLPFSDERPFSERYKELKPYSPETILQACREKLQKTIQVFDVSASPRSFELNSLEQFFFKDFVNNIYSIVYNLPDSHRYIGNKDKVVENLSQAMTEIRSAVSERRKVNGESDIQKKREYSKTLYTYLRDYVNYLEQSLDYWGLSSAVGGPSVAADLKHRLEVPKSAIQTMHGAIEFNTDIALPLIESHEQGLRVKIIAPLAKIPGEIIKADGKKEFIYSKDGTLKHLREAKIELNLALDECDLIIKGEDTREFYECLQRCTFSLREAIKLLN